MIHSDCKAINVVYIFLVSKSSCNTLKTQIKGMPEPIYHIYMALPTSLKNDVVIGNGGSTFFMYTFIEGI